MTHHSLAFVFAIGVVIAWGLHHQVDLLETLPKLLILLPILALPAVAIAIVQHWFHRRRQPFPVFSPLILFGLFILFTFVLFNWVGFLPLPAGNAPALAFADWEMTNTAFLKKIALLVGLISITTLVFHATGQIATRWLKIKSLQHSPSLLQALSLITFGMFLWSVYTLILGMTERLTPWFIWTPALLLLVLNVKQVRVFSVWSVQSVTLPTHFFETRTLVLVSVIVFILATSLIESLRPFPTGYDDMTAYMNRATLMAERGALVMGGNPFPFELLSASLAVAWPRDDFLLGLALGLLSYLFSASVVFAVARDWLGARAALIGSAIWLTLPMNSALAFFEVKPDSLLAGVLLLAFWTLACFAREKKSAWLAWTAFFFGMAVSIKLTALFFVGASALLFFFIFKQSPEALRNMRAWMTVAFLFFLPLTPWIALRVATLSPDAPLAFPTLLTSPEPQPILSEATWAKLGINPETMCESTGLRDDRLRYRGNTPSPADWLSFPWDLTMNNRVRLYATEIGFLFLALLPFLLLTSLSGRIKGVDLSHPGSVMSILAIGYFGLWLIFGHFIPWYVFPGFALLAMLVAQVVTSATNKKILTSFFFVFLVIGLMAHLLIRTRFAFESQDLRWAGGQIDDTSYLRESFPAFPAALETLNADPSARVIIMGSGLRYFVTNNDRRVILDSALDVFTCLDQERDNAKTLARLQVIGIDYVSVSAATFLPLRLQDASPLLQKKVRRFRDFADTELSLLTRARDGVLYAVPRDGR